MDNYFRKCISEMEGYSPGEQPKGDFSNIIKLNTNENPYPPTPKIKEFLRTFDYEKLNRYPDPNADILRNKIAKKFGLNRGNIIVGNGSDEILSIVVRSFIGEGEYAASFYPSYSLYPVLVQSQGGKTIYIPLNRCDFSFPQNLLNIEGELFNSIAKTKIFFIARPNSPTGTNIQMDYLKRLAEIYSGILLIDEAYADFSKDSALELLHNYSNVLILRTLSKSYALAGVRVGWGMGSSEIVTGMMKVKDSYNVNLLSQSLAELAMDDENYLNRITKEIIERRKRYEKFFKAIGFKVVESNGNFIFLSPGEGDIAYRLFKFLQSNNILIRYFNDSVLKEYLRVTVGSEEDMRVVYHFCKKFIAELK